MDSKPPTFERKLGFALTRFDLWSSGALFVFVVVCGAIVLKYREIELWMGAHPLFAACALAFGVGAVIFGGVRRIWHAVANRIGVSELEVLRAVWVVDGDTIDDRATGVRFRFANIDAPEIGDNAKCHRERQLGETAKSAAIRAVRSATSVAVRKTFRKDRYGRRVAFVYVDGQDLGDLLVARGLASPWTGYRRRWCGRSGQLAALAKVRGETSACKACQEWRS